jgi:hypothetical protein
MQKPPLNPDLADTAPSDSVLTVYDEEHTITYLRLLDADAEGADWREVARIVLHLDPEHDSDRARRVFDSHLFARQMDDGAWLPAPATWWRVGLKRGNFTFSSRASNHSSEWPTRVSIRGADHPGCRLSICHPFLVPVFSR